MATEFQKTYSITVTFTKDDYHNPDLTDEDIQAVELRNEIIKAIEHVCRRTKGVYNTQPGSVTEEDVE